jgi:hypothetical protein
MVIAAMLGWSWREFFRSADWLRSKWVPRLRRSYHDWILTQPFRAGLTFSGRPSGPQWDLRAKAVLLRVKNVAQGLKSLRENLIPNSDLFALEKLLRMLGLGFVSGHDFSRAIKS